MGVASNTVLSARTKLFIKSNLYGNIINLIHAVDLIDCYHKTKKEKLFSRLIRLEELI